MPSIGSVPYLNALPLLEGLEAATQTPIVFDSPARLHERVLRGEIDVALLPVISYLENPELRLIPGTGIVSHGEVRSVKAFHEKKGVGLANCRRVHLDTDSKTSRRLLNLLLLKKYERDFKEIEFVESPQQADTILQIGDKALEKSHFGNSTDLGSEWQELTGLPFVYACWMSRVPITQELLTQLHNAKMTGRQSLEEIAARQKLVPPEEALSYLTRNIQYDIDGPELVGLKMFFDWVVELENQSYDTSLRFVA
ncbi:MAG: menaquinone biosynthesis protein [bacterium]